jgi:hypothetical protein
MPEGGLAHAETPRGFADRDQTSALLRHRQPGSATNAMARLSISIGTDNLVRNVIAA